MLRLISILTAAAMLAGCTSNTHLPTLVGDESYRPWGTDAFLIDSKMHVLPTPYGASPDRPSRDIVELLQEADEAEQSAAVAEDKDTENTSEAINASAVKALAKKKRNDLQNILILRSDQLCSRYQTALLANYDAAQYFIPLIGPFTQSAANALKELGTLGTLVESIGTFTTANPDKLLGKDLLYQTAITNSLQTSRELRFDMSSKLRAAQDEGSDKYSLKQAVVDANRYHRLCNFYDVWNLGDLKTQLKDMKLVPAADGDAAQKSSATTSTTPPTTNEANPTGGTSGQGG